MKNMQDIPEEKTVLGSNQKEDHLSEKTSNMAELKKIAEELKEMKETNQSMRLMVGILGGIACALLAVILYIIF